MCYYDVSKPFEKIFTQQWKKGSLPVHGVQRVGLVVVPSLMMAHVNRDRCVESWEDVVGGCKSRKAKKKRELAEQRGEEEETSKNFQRQKGYNKATWISEQAEHFRVKYWHYHTREVE